MKRNFFIPLLAIALVGFVACDKDDDTNNNVDVVGTPVTAADTVFANLGVEESKTYIEDEGYKMLDEMKAMDNEPAIGTNATLVKFMDMSDPFEDNPNFNGAILKSIAFSPVFASANYHKTGVKGILKSVQVNPADDPESIQEFYDQLVGIYEWDFNQEGWIYTQTGNKIIFRFPSEEQGTSNNASYTVSYAGYNGPNPIKDDPDFDYNGDLPQNVSASLQVDNVEISAFKMDVVYNSSGYPTFIESSFSMGKYKLTGKITSTDNKEFGSSLTFTHDNNILVGFSIDASGNWTKENIDENYQITTEYYMSVYNSDSGYWEYVQVSENDNWDYYEEYTEFNIHKVITSGNASFQAMNLKVAGTIDAENFGDRMKEIDETYDWDTQEEEINNVQVEAINQYVNLTLRYADNNQIIAMCEAYPVSEENTYTDWVYNEITQQWDEVEVTETDYWFGLRFVFADGSKVDAETYFDDTFTDLGDAIDEWINDLEDTYGK